MIGRLIAFLLVGFGMSCSGQVLSLAVESFEFGNIDNVKPVTREVEYTNTGDKDLILEKVKGSCGCTTPTNYKKILTPGETGSVEVTFNPQGRSGFQTKSVNFFSNDVEKKLRSVKFTAQIVPIWEITPKRLEFSFTAAGNGVAYAATEQTVTINNTAERPISIQNIRSDHEQISIGMPDAKEIQPGESMEFTARISPDYVPPRGIYTRIRVNAKVDDENTFHVVRTSILPPPATSPPAKSNSPASSGAKPEGSGSR